jgi:hypothetical protein
MAFRNEGTVDRVLPASAPAPSSAESSFGPADVLPAGLLSLPGANRHDASAVFVERIDEKLLT